ncbi:MAG: transporter substrate-binding domain-containing protein [Desulfamplus sp.]|nr:transporter substrate-binding domain-containing protein [Desulfamplus sp.]
MKKIIVFALMTIGLAVNFGYSEEIEVPFITGEWAPYTSEQLPEYGAATELVSAICKAGGIKPSYKFYPWKRAENIVEKGQAFASFPYAAKDEKKAVFDFSDTMFYGINVVIYNVKNPKTPTPIKFEKLGDLKDYKVGVLLGSFLEKELANAGVAYETTPQIENTIKKLQAGRIDFYIDEQVAAYDMIKKLFPTEVDNFKTLEKGYGEKMPNIIIVSRTYPNSKEILKKFNEGLAIIKQNGEYDRITDKYKMVK